MWIVTYSHHYSACNGYLICHLNWRECSQHNHGTFWVEEEPVYGVSNDEDVVTHM